LKGWALSAPTVEEEKADSDDLAAILLKQLGLTSAPEGEEESSATVGAVARESDSVE
jgi:hypothetical protein